MNGTDYDPALLKSLRARTGMSQGEVGRKIGRHWVTVWRAEAGEVASYDLLKRITALYGLPVQTVLRSNGAS